MKRFGTRFVLVIFIAYAMAGASVSLMSHYGAPVIDRDANFFWLNVFGINVAEGRRETALAFFYQSEEGSVYYYSQGLRGVILFRSKLNELEESLDRVRSCVEKCAGQEELPEHLRMLFKHTGDESEHLPVEELIAEMDAAKRAQFSTSPGFPTAIKYLEHAAAQLHQKDEQHWKKQLFEFFWLGTYLVVAVIPWFVPLSPSRLFLYCLLATAIFFVPHWFGYPETVLAMSGSGTEGIVYQYLLGFGYWMLDFEIDQRFIDTCRQLTAFDAFDYQRFTWRVRIGPLAAICLGVCLGGLAVILQTVGGHFWQVILEKMGRGRG